MIVAGKGGVGKTTMVAALAHLAAGAGLSVLVIELEGRTGVTTAFGGSGDLGYAGEVLHAAGATDLGGGDVDEAARIPPGTVHARTITPDDALLEYLDDHGMRRFSKRLLSSGIIDIVAGAIPGIRDILVLGKVKQIEQQGVADLILVDAPATGHTMTFLSSAAGLLDAARGGPSGPRRPTWSPCCPTRRGARWRSSPCPRRCRSTRWSRRPTSSRTGWASPSAPSSSTPATPRVAGLDVPAAATVAAAGVDLAAGPRSRPSRTPGRSASAGSELQEEQVDAAGRGAAAPPAPGPLPVCRRHRAPGAGHPQPALGRGIEALHEPDPVTP